jgi:small subunit ribosomal protein S18
LDYTRRGDMPEDTKKEEVVTGEQEEQTPENEPAAVEKETTVVAAAGVSDSDTSAEVASEAESKTDKDAEKPEDVSVQTERTDKTSGDTEKDREKPARPPARRQYGSGRGRSDTQRSGQNNGPRQRRGYFRKKVCRLCVNKIKTVDYKDVDLLKRFVTDRGKILPRRMTGTCAKHQRVLSAAVKRARMAALLPFVKK